LTSLVAGQINSIDDSTKLSQNDSLNSSIGKESTAVSYFFSSVGAKGV